MLRSLLLLSLLAATTAQAAYKKVISGPEDYILMLQDDGAVFAAGDCILPPYESGCEYVSKLTRIELPGPAVDVAGATATGYAVLADGSVYSWGSDNYYMLGRMPPSGKRNGRRNDVTPAKIPGLPKAVSVVATRMAAAVVTESGELWMWGVLYDDHRGASSESEVPKRIEGLPPITAFTMGSRTYPGVHHMFALAKDGSVWTWGFNALGQLGNGTTEPVPVPKKINLPPAVSIAAGGNNGVAVLADGTVRVWGANDSSTMANGQNAQGDSFPNPTPVAGITGAASVTAGLGHIIVQLKNGTLRTWGHDGWGQAGIGTHGGYQMKPATPKLTGVKASFAAQNRCFAITQDGKLWFWGPSYSKLSGLLRQNQYAPVDVTAVW